MARLKEVPRVTVSGDARFDTYSKEIVVMARNVLEASAKSEVTRQDRSEVKRVELHMHTQMSQMDGITPVEDLINRARKWGMKSIAITDHGVMYGAVNFYKECVKEGIKPIIGCEVYVAPRSRFDKDGAIDKEYNHLILLAKNNEGYKNLSKLVSIGFTGLL